MTNFVILNAKECNKRKQLDLVSSVLECLAC